VADYLPHTDAEVATMLEFLGLASTEQLFAVVPEALKVQAGLELAAGQSEPDVFARMESLAEQNLARADRMVCFAGGGAYDHEVPSVVRALGGRSEFMTAYTPYQPEVAQGVLQAVFEFQTMAARLAGLPVANASLYELVEVPLEDGVTRWPSDGGQPGVIVAAYPNYLGCLEDLGAVRALADQHGAIMVVAADPVSAGIVRSAGDWGADVVVGEGQAFGTPLGFGGPYLGLFACTLAQVRRLPGRLVGETVDTEGTRAYVTTLRAREQDIRREKATSNVCTNQTLMAVVAAIQLGWLGTRGLAEVARRCALGAHYCHDALVALDGVEPLTPGASFVREFAIRTPIPARTASERLAEEGFLAGLVLADLTGEGGDGSVSADGAEHGLLVAVTERRTRTQIDAFVGALDKAVR